MPSAKRLSSGNWRVLAYVGKDKNGKRQYKSFTNADKKQAEFEAAEFLVKRKKENKAENLTFKAASDQYIQNKANLLSPSTLRGYRIMQNNAFPDVEKETIGKLAVNNSFQKQMNENAKKYAAKSLKNQLGFITAVMGYFNYHIDRITIKPREKKKILVPTKSDSVKIIMLLRTAPEIECQALLALSCSLRQSEIAALTPADISGNSVHVHGALVPNEKGELVYKPTNKSSAGTRTDTMPDYLAKRMEERCKGLNSTDYIFSLPPDAVLYRFKRLLKANGLPPYTVHSLRHCFAATLHAMHVPDKYIMEMGGWDTDSVMKDIYQYAFEDETQKVKKKANAYFDHIMQHEMQHKK
ncbi:MAG TPA: site-specific integrase [Caproicibacter sp.]|nr:site-specific integrase [Caproicibacter sp.]